MVIPKYLASIIAIATVLFGALAQLTGPIGPTEAVQLALLLVGAVGVYVGRLLDGSWAAGLKVGVAVATAVLTALAPLVVGNHTWSGSEVSMIILAGIQALGAQVGVDARLDARKLRSQLRDDSGRFAAGG